MVGFYFDGTKNPAQEIHPGRTLFLTKRINFYFEIFAGGTTAFLALIPFLVIFPPLAVAGFFTVFFGGSCANADTLNIASTENMAMSFFMVVVFV